MIAQDASIPRIDPSRRPDPGSPPRAPMPRLEDLLGRPRDPRADDEDAAAAVPPKAPRVFPGL